MYTSNHSKRETIVNNRLDSVDVSDASCQANITYEVITYDSDDEMVKSRRGMPFGGVRNKKGHPNMRALLYALNLVLEALSSRRAEKPCLSSSHMPDSQCSKNSFLMLSCVNKQKNSTETIQQNTQPFDTTKRLQHLNTQTIANISEDEDSDGGFRQYIKPYSQKLSVDEQKYNHFSSELRDGKRNQYKNMSASPHKTIDYSRSKVRLHQSNSSGSQDINKSSIRSSIYASQGTTYTSSTSHSAEELLDYNSGQQMWSSQQTGSGPRMAETGGYDISSKKHVSFDSGDNKVRRSVTCSSGIASIHMNARQQQHPQHASPPSISLTSTTSSTRRDMSPPVASQERLLGSKTSQHSIDENVKPLQQSVSPSLSYTPSLSTPCRLVRRVIMKTQATQTEATQAMTKSRSSRSIPAYLTLSPRANNQQIVHRRSFDLRVPTTPISLCEYHQRLILRQTHSWGESDANNALPLPLIKSRSVHGIMINTNSNIEFNDEIMQVCIDRDFEESLRATNSSSHRLREDPAFCDNHIDQPFDTFLQPLKSSVKSYSNDEVFMPKRKQDIEGEDGRLIRRHSAKADLAAEPIGSVPIASPPPGFGDIEVFPDLDDNNKDLSDIELSPKKSISESSHAMITNDGSDVISSITTDIDDLQSSANNSKVTNSSPTVVSELNADVPSTPPPLIESDSIDLMTMDSPISRLKKQLMETLISPDSESSSLHITSPTTSSDIKSDVEFTDKIDDTCHTYTKEKPSESDPKSTSKEKNTMLLESDLSSDALTITRVLQRKSDPIIEDNSALQEQEFVKIRSLSVPTLKRPTTLVSKRQLLRSEETCDERRSSSSSEASIPAHSPHSPESIASTHFSANVEDIDSDLQDLTPIQEIYSSDPSTAVETTTIIESVPQTKPKIPPKPSFLSTDRNRQEPNAHKDLVNEFELTAVADTHEENIDSEEIKQMAEEIIEDFKETSEDLTKDIIVEEEDNVIDEPMVAPIPLRRSLSGELSTVSEVSEEISFNDMCAQKSVSSIDKDYNEYYDRDSMAPALTLSGDGLSSENIAIHSGATSPSLADSTTSGSFMIDASVTEATSGDESNRVTIGKAGSLPCLPTQAIANITKVASEGGVGECFSRKPKTQSTVTTDLEQNASVVSKRYEPIVGQLIDLTTESSQATERDIEKSEFSLQHQSSQDIDEESLSLDALNHSFSLKDGHEEQAIEEVDEEDSQGLALLQELSTSESTTTQQFSDRKKNHVSEEVKKNNKKVVKNQRNSSSESHTLLSQEDFYIMQRRARSLSRSPEKGLEAPAGHYFQSCSHHHFTCSQCGESANKHSVPSLLRRSRLERTGIPYLYRKSMTIDDIYCGSDEDEEDAGVHTESYRSSLWVYIGRKEEVAVWGHRNPLSLTEDKSLPRSESDESTLSEKGFKKHYEAITHRLIHRKASIEMYKRVLNRTFDTPAEMNGLEVGDIIVSVNETNVLEASHSDVVKLAHTGSDTLKLEVICTSKSIKKNQPPVEHDILMNGYLSRLTDKSADKERALETTQSHGTNKLWRRRWFVLKSDFCLYWYKNPKGTEPVGAISLHGYCAGVCNETIFGQCFVFRLVRYGTPQKYFAAIDRETAGQWVNALNQSATRINQIDPYIDSTLHNIHKNPLSLKHLDCYGYLGKFSKRRKVWRHRYLVLKDACLYFYADANSNTAL
ncbi:unnamed protein product, partial [Medioppia subpectinata]